MGQRKSDAGTRITASANGRQPTADGRTAPRTLSQRLLPGLHELLARPLSSYYLLITSAGLLLLIGLTMVFSATSVSSYAASGSSFVAARGQLIYAVLGLVAFWAFQRLPIGALRRIGVYVLAGAILLLCVLDLLVVLRTVGLLHSQPGESRVSLGPVSANLLWLTIGPVSLQPSELAKLGIALWAAAVIAGKGADLGRWRDLAVPLLPMTAVLFVLVGYNDLGTMLVILALLIGLLWTAGVRLRFFAGLGAIGLTGVATLIAAASHGAGSGATGEPNYRLLRLTTWINPPQDCGADLCYQILQARSAMFEGGWFGVGLGESALKWNWLPEADNDFIYAVVSEELGVVGCLVIAALFAVLTYTGFRIARRVNDPFRRLAASGITTWLAAQAVINMGGVIGLLPLTGVPLPLISAGGSSLVVTMASLGILTACARTEPDAARALHARPSARWVQILWAPLPPSANRRPRPPSSSQ